MLAPSAVPRLWRLARLGYDDVRDRPVLLYPEGAVLLNETGHAILELLDGERSVAEIGALLAERYGAPAGDVTSDVQQYLDGLVQRELVHVR